MIEMTRLEGGLLGFQGPTACGRAGGAHANYLITLCLSCLIYKNRDKPPSVLVRINQLIHINCLNSHWTHSEHSKNINNKKHRKENQKAPWSWICVFGGNCFIFVIWLCFFRL